MMNDWQPIENVANYGSIIGWGPQCGFVIAYWSGKQWDKCELSAPFQLGPKALTHWMPLPAPPAQGIETEGEDATKIAASGGA